MMEKTVLFMMETIAHCRLLMEKAVKLEDNDFERLALSAKNSVCQTNWQIIARIYMKLFSQK